MKQILCRYCSYEHHKPALFHFHCFFVFISTSPSHQLSLLPSLFCSPCYPFPQLFFFLSSLLAWERKIWMITGWLIAMALDQPITGRRFHSLPITGGQYHSRPITGGQYHTAPHSQVDNITANSRGTISQPITGGQYHSRPITSGQYHSRPSTGGQYHSRPITSGQYQRTVSLGRRSEKISIFPKNFTEPT